ncbi:META domain-containing protein [Candidatus Gracilibacteria bacterium]|nr:META domain-containing protein [Candidatus Gracilibacteria bacterium]
MAALAGATDVTGGTCIMSESTPPIVGGDRDKYGCIVSAGYSWESRMGQCLRPSESRVRPMNISPIMTSCVFGMNLTQCLQARFAGWNLPWNPIYGGISGYTHISGSTDRILVLETRLIDPSADGLAITYSFIKMLSRPSSILPIENPLLGTWTLSQFNDMSITNSNHTLVFERDRVSAKFCNNMSGSYSLSGNTIMAPMMTSTMMYCEGQPMTLENAFQLNNATYSLIALRLMAGSTGSTMQLIITTKNGDRFTYGMR